MNIMQRINQEMSTVVDRVGRSLVQIQNGHRGVGAGTIWHPAGLILTNAHVVARHSRRSPHHLRIILHDGRAFRATVLAEDPQRDLAALCIDADDLPVIELGNARALRPGDWLMAMGHPWGVSGAITAGNVIALGPSPEIQWAGGDLLQVSLHLRPGHSGGPMVDSAGRLVGINMMIAGPDAGLAIPIHTVKRFLKEKIGSG